MRLPIRIRLALIYTAIMVVVVGALEAGAYLAVHTALYSIADRELEMRAAGIEDHITRHVERLGWAKLREALNVHPAFQPAYLLIRTDSGDVIYRGLSMTDVDLPVQYGASTMEGFEHAMRLLTVRRTMLGHTYDLVMGTDLQAPAAVLDRLWLIMLISMPPLLLICAGAGYWMSGRALAPVERIIAAARSIDTRRLNQRVMVPNSGDEIQQLAETFNEMLGRIEIGFRNMREFTANASHELRTPVAIVRAAAEIALLKPRADSAYYRTELERILRESERNSSLLEDMLELSRIDSSIDSMEREWINLDSLLNEACERMAPLADSRRISLRMEWSDVRHEVLVNRDQLRRVWLILIDNAIKYTPEDGHVIARVRHGADGEAIVEIEDTGIGIAPEDRELIFERFFRADKARSRAMGGVGLGLAIAREIVDLHGANIAVTSQIGKGSRFFVTFAAEHTNYVRAAAAGAGDCHLILR